MGAWTARGPGLRWAALGYLAQGEVHFQADVVLDAQDPQEPGLGRREGRELEGGPGLEAGTGMGRPRISCGPISVQANGDRFSDGANARQSGWSFQKCA